MSKYTKICKTKLYISDLLTIIQTLSSPNNILTVYKKHENAFAP